MEVSWPTFILEILNFLVLVWLLKRFLYKPVLNIIAQRRAGIEKTMADAAAVREEALRLQEQYQHRLADWEQEKATAQTKLREEIDAERKVLMTKLDASIEEARAKARAQDDARQAEMLRHSQEVALRQAAKFASSLLTRLASPELAERLITLLIEELNALAEEPRHALHDALNGAATVQVSSSHPIGADLRDAVAESLSRVSGRRVACEFEVDPGLLAGARVVAGSSILHANLRDELQAFAEVG